MSVPSLGPKQSRGSQREAKRPKPCPLSAQQQEWSRPPVTLHLPVPSSVASSVFLLLNQECLVFLSRLAILSCGPLLLFTLSCPHPPPLRTSGRTTCSICGEPDARVGGEAPPLRTLKRSKERVAQCLILGGGTKGIHQMVSTFSGQRAKEFCFASGLLSWDLKVRH